MKKLVFATNNAHKLSEVRAMLSPEYQIISPAELNCFDDIPETASTLEGNAKLKAEYIYQKFGMDCFADDTGLEVEALGGEPGVYSARYAGEGHDAQANMKKLLANMADITAREAGFRTVISLIIDGKCINFEGRVDGTIATASTGEGGFGYDPIFIPEGYTLSFAQLTPDEKNSISHRGRAVQKLVHYLKQIQENTGSY